MKILIIDDESVNLELLEEYLKDEGYETISAVNGSDGFALLQQNPDVTLVLLDRTMPIMDGIQFMQKMRMDNNFINIPVVMQTAVADNESIAEGINSGVYYYLTKPYKRNVLVSIVRSAVTDALYKKDIISEMNNGRKAQGLINQAWFEFQTMVEAQNLAYFIAASFPEPDKVVLGLSEIFINAVEHGNLGLTYQEKGDFMRQGQLNQEISRRAALVENKHKKVQVFFKKTQSEIKVIVKDEGRGFDWREFHEMHPERATDPNGRGIIMARMMSFDKLEYSQIGNEVCCVVQIKAESSA